MTTPTQADREAAAHIDALEWLFCDGRVNPRLLAISPVPARPAGPRHPERRSMSEAREIELGCGATICVAMFCLTLIVIVGMIVK